jgi:hypothetical protein
MRRHDPRIHPSSKEDGLPDQADNDESMVGARK